MTCYHVWSGFDGRHCGECAPKPVTPRKNLRQVMQSGDPYWPGGEVEQKAWFAGYDAAAAEAHGLLRQAASLVYRIEASGPIDDERTNFERWKADARALAPELRASLATQPATSQEGEGTLANPSTFAKPTFGFDVTPTPPAGADEVLRMAVAKLLPIGNDSLPGDRVIPIYVRMDELRALHALSSAQVQA